MPFNYDRFDGMMGAIAALEGVSDAYTLIHGPTGCKYYPASCSESNYRYRSDGNPTGRNLFRYHERYFFSQPRLPCTYMDDNVFIMGAGDRLSELYGKVEAMSPALIGMVNSPGASLIGEDLTSVGGSIPTVRLDGSGFSDTPGKGFQDSLGLILDAVPPRPSGRKRGVNLIGISILHLNWEDSVADLRSLLECCGVHINCVAGAGWTVEDIRSSADAELNVIVYPEYGKDIAIRYERDHGIPYFESPAGAPIGFESLESWVSGVCRIMDTDPTPAMSVIKERRARTARAMSLMETCRNLPKGRTFSVEGEGSMVYAVSSFLYSYLGMVPAAISCPDGGEWKERTERLFASAGIPVSDDIRHVHTDVAIGSGGLCASMMRNGMASGGVDISPPPRKSVNIEPNPVLGLTGTVRLLDKIANIVWDRS